MFGLLVHYNQCPSDLVYIDLRESAYWYIIISVLLI